MVFREHDVVTSFLIKSFPRTLLELLWIPIVVFDPCFGSMVPQLEPDRLVADWLGSL